MIDAAARSPLLEEFFGQIDSARHEAVALAQGLTATQGRWRAAPGRWSVAECLQHLNQTLGAYLPVFDEAIGRAPAAGPARVRPRPIGLMGRWLIRTMEPPPKRSFKAVSVVVPPTDLSVQTVLAEFLAGQDQLEQRVRRCLNVDVARVKVVSPLNRWFRFRLDVGVAFLLAHQRRHLYQARQVLAAPGFAQAGGRGEDHVL